MISQRKPRKMPHISDSNYHEGRTLSLSPPVCLSTCTLFPPNKHFVSLLSAFMGIHFCKAVWARALSLATGLVVRIQCSHCCGLTSVWELKSCFKQDWELNGNQLGTEILLQGPES